MRRKITYDPTRDYYIILGIDTHATPEDIRRAYRDSVRRVHPDVNPDRAEWATEQIQRVNEAYDVLGNPARRKQYDRLRWPHIPTGPAQEHSYRNPFQERRYHGPFAEPTYDYSRPWWDQVAERAPRGYSIADDPPSPSGREAPLSQPFWLAVAAWMKGHRLGVLGPAWLTLIGLWRSPYAGVLTILAVALGINIAAIVYVADSPQRWASVQEWLDTHNGRTQTAANTPTPDRLIPTCDNPGVQLKTPSWGDSVGDTFSIFGTVQHPELWNYRLMIGFVGETLRSAAPPNTWIPVREPPPNQRSPEPALEDTLLTELPVDLTGQPPGFYAIRLQVTLRNGQELPPCDVVVRHP